MPSGRGIFLTGATGLLGQYLLRDLFVKGHPVAVLVRDTPNERAVERIARIVDFWSERLGRHLPFPTLLCGDLDHTGLGLTVADRSWLGRHCQTVIHSAANLSFRSTPEGEPWRTNVDGTRSLLELCRNLGLSDFHHVSTAFVCGRRSGIISEDGLGDCPEFHNPYEESKFQAESLIRRTAGLRATIYRPSIIVGDSRTGHTSTFMGLYRFLELGAHLASADSRPDIDSPRLRLPLSGDEPWNLVPLDWVSSAIVELLGRTEWHGRNFHLVSRSPVPTRLIRDVGVKELNLCGIEFAGHEGIERPSRREQLFNNGIREYWPYLGGNPIFTFENSRKALPSLPPPSVDRTMLERLIRFAIDNHWGRNRTPAQPAPVQSTDAVSRDRISSDRSFSAEYIEQVFPRQANRSKLAREAGLNLTVCFDVRGPQGGEWSCKWTGGELASVKQGLEAGAEVTYHTDPETLRDIVNGTLSPQEAFFEQRIEISGDVESALKLTVLFGLFLVEERIEPSYNTDVINASTSRV